MVPKAIDALNTAPGREAGMSSGTVSKLKLEILALIERVLLGLANASFPSPAAYHESKRLRSRWEADQTEREV